MKKKNRENLRKLQKNIFNFYINYWQYLWVLFILIIGNFNFPLIKKFPPPENINHMQGIYLGLITFSIPFLWNVYSKILEIQHRLTVDNIEKILNREFYKKANNLFYIVLLVPFTILLLGGLVFSSMLSIMLVRTILIISFFLILFSTKIYQWIENRSKTQLEDFIKENPINEDLQSVFKELLSKTDTAIESELNLHPVKLMTLFTQKINEGIEKPEQQRIIRDLLLLFQINLDNRLLWTLNTSNFWSNFLQWHFKIWKNYHLDPHNNYIAFDRIHNIFFAILKRSLRDPSSEYYLFIDIFVKHINTFRNEIVNVDGRDEIYIEYFLGIFCNILFEEYSKSPHHNSLWDIIPYDWKITSKNLQEEKKSAKYMLNNFLDWSRTRIINAERGKWDKALDEIAYNLFPETEPCYWADILNFVFSPYIIEKRVQSAIERPLTFGLLGRELNDTEWGEYTEVKEQKEREFPQRQVEETIKLAKMVFRKSLSKENVEKYLEEIKILEDKYDKADVRYGNLQQLKTIFELLLKQ
ncbi:MAG TPA: hypothetical protein PLE69_04470 [bacterium]|nr:hypothetical protein [bacterium]